MIKVSLCIPTFNRDEYLKECIDSIIVQKEFLIGDVEIVVSDNASTDRTQIICEEYASRYTNFYYYRNDENIGGDRNFIKALSLGNGKYCKLINDTFLLSVDSLQVITSMVDLYDEQMPVLFFNNKNIDKSIREVDFKEFVRSETFWITWIGAMGIWTEERNNLNSDESACDLNLWAAKRVLDDARRKEKIIICNKLIGKVKEVKKKDLSYGLYKVFYVNYLNLLKQYMKEGLIVQEDIEYVERDLLFRFFRVWILKNEYEADSGKFIFSKEENLKELVTETYNNKPYWDKYCEIYEKHKEQYLNDNIEK